MTSELPRLPGRRRTYALVVASAIGLAVVGTGLPLVLGHAPSATPVLAAGGGPATLTTGPSAGGSGQLPTTASATPSPGSTVSPGASTVPAGGGATGLPGETGQQGLPGQPVSGAGQSSVRPGGAVPGPRSSGGTPRRTAPVGSAPGTTRTGAAQPTGPTLTASDVGVTPTTINVGFLLTDFGTANSAGATVTGYSPAQQQEYFQAYVADVNAHGGVDGRMIVPKFETSDITDGNSQSAACATITDTDKSFVVTNVLGIYGPPITCLTVTHHTPYVANDGAVSDYYTQSQGNLFTLQPSTLRTEANAIYEDAQAGEFKAGDKVGFLREDGYLTADETSVEDYLRSFGVTVTDGVMSASSLEDAPGQAEVAAQKFCASGDTKVFFAVNSLYAEDFITSLPPNCQPAYYSSDFDYQMDGNTFVSGMPASYFTHAIGVSSSDIGSAFTPTMNSCLATYNGYETSHGKSAVPASNEVAIQAVAACGLVRTIVLGLRSAGVNPTQSSFDHGLANVGAFDDPAYDDGTFHGSKTDAPDTVRTVQANAACKCWQATGNGAFHAAHFR